MIHFGYVFVLQALDFSNITQGRGVSIWNSTNLIKLVFVCPNEWFISCDSHLNNQTITNCTSLNVDISEFIQAGRFLLKIVQAVWIIASAYKNSTIYQNCWLVWPCDHIQRGLLILAHMNSINTFWLYDFFRTLKIFIHGKTFTHFSPSKNFPLIANC